jgi:hypothetical protein
MPAGEELGLEASQFGDGLIAEKPLAGEVEPRAGRLELTEQADQQHHRAEPNRTEPNGIEPNAPPGTPPYPRRPNWHSANTC